MTLRRIVRTLGGLTVAACLAAAPLAPASGKARRQPNWGGANAPLRPGSSLGGYCTFNFVFYSPGTASRPPKGYIGTAGHCTDKIGEKVSHATLGEIGKVVYDSDLRNSTVDFALIEIHPKFVSKTNPSVLNWGGPTRSVNQEDLVQMDQINVYGYGLLLGQTEQTRPRSGFLIDWTRKEYQADMPAVNGDSGAPLIHDLTGAALGIISRYGTEDVPPSTDKGPLMPWILEQLDKAGLNVRLATVRR